MTTLIGTNPDQIPVNAMLGGMAYQDPDSVSVRDVTYSGTLTGGTGIINIGSGQVYKDASGNVGIGIVPSGNKLAIAGTGYVFKIMVSGTQYNGLGVQCTDASGSNARNVFYDIVNESGATVANMVGGINTDGSSEWSWETQSPGARTDRRSVKMRLSGLGDLILLGTGATKLQEGTTAERPATPQEGMLRKNSTLDVLEFYSDGVWKNLSSQVGRNLLINGGFDVSQRLVNDSPFIQATTIGLGTGLERPLFDRWILQSSASGAFNVSVASAKQYGLNVPGIDRMAVLRKVGAGSQTCMLSQRIENGHNFQFVNGQTFTLSFWAKSSAASDMISLQIFEPIATNNTWSSVGTTPNTTSIFSSNAATTTSWQRYTFTFDTASVNGARGMMVTFYHISSVDAEELYIAGVQLEEGIYATDYEIKSKEQILKECERYFCTFSSAAGTCIGTNAAAVSYQFRTPMMATPNTIAGQNISWWSGASSNGASPIFGGFNGNRFGGVVGYGPGTGTWGGFTTGAAIVLSGTQIIKFEAEL